MLEESRKASRKIILEVETFFVDAQSDERCARDSGAASRPTSKQETGTSLVDSTILDGDDHEA